MPVDELYYKLQDRNCQLKIKISLQSELEQVMEQTV
jgi:hypothetical protein